MNKKEKKK